MAFGISSPLQPARTGAAATGPIAASLRPASSATRGAGSGASPRPQSAGKAAITARQGVLQPSALKAVAGHAVVGVATREEELASDAAAIRAAWPTRPETMATVTEATPDGP